MDAETKKRSVELTVGGKLRSFDIDDPVLPTGWRKTSFPPVIFLTTKR